MGSDGSIGENALGLSRSRLPIIWPRHSSGQFLHHWRRDTGADRAATRICGCQGVELEALRVCA